MEQVNILGAGLSGLTAAINLVKAGFEVNVFDVRKDSGARFEGDLQGLENWTTEKDILKDLKEMNLKVNFHCNPFKKAITTNGKETFETEYPIPLFYLVKRGTMKDSIDQGLKRQAIDAGVKINYNTKFEGKTDIIATGPKIQGKSYGIDKGIVFDTDMDDIAVAIINNGAGYNAYSYLLVSEGYGCIATVVLEKFHLVNKCLEKTKEILNKMFDLKIENEKGVGGFGNFGYPPKLEENGGLVVGESGLLQDALAGFGMRYAITSGFLAAKSIKGECSYADTIKERFSHQLKASIVNRFIWELAGDNIFNFVKLGRKRKDSLSDLRKLYNFQMFHQKLLYPLAFMWLNKKYRRDA